MYNTHTGIPVKTDSSVDLSRLGFNKDIFYILFVTQICFLKICIASYIHTSLYNTVLITKHIFLYV